MNTVPIIYLIYYSLFALDVVAVEYTVYVGFLEEAGLFPMEERGLTGSFELISVFYSSWFDFNRVNGLIKSAFSWLATFLVNLNFLVLLKSMVPKGTTRFATPIRVMP